ncbi:MAG: SAM-dependent methyltransferase [Acidobacteria bacterium]|nr:MAG: SAM-dependent methyltransferase [Acidobacteriota bacterium]
MKVLQSSMKYSWLLLLFWNPAHTPDCSAVVATEVSGLFRSQSSLLDLNPPVHLSQLRHALSGQTTGTYKGRTIAPVMSAAGADWLTREDRERNEQPEKVLDALNIREGMTVADIGAGVGYFSLRLARRVSNNGRVLAVDVQSEMLELLKKNMEKQRVSNIDLIQGSPVDPHLPENSVDLALLVDVYHEFQTPEEMMSRIRSSLKSDGRLVLIEYRGEDPNVPIKPEHKMTVKQVLFEIEPMGFRLKETLEFLPWQHIFIFVRD